MVFIRVMMFLIRAILFMSPTIGLEWIPYSGALAHMTMTAPLTNVAACNDHENVMVADGIFLPITQVWSTILTTSIGGVPLNDILVCLSM